MNACSVRTTRSGAADALAAADPEDRNVSGRHAACSPVDYTTVARRQRPQGRAQTASSETRRRLLSPHRFFLAIAKPASAAEERPARDRRSREHRTLGKFADGECEVLLYELKADLNTL